jgi:hypothetical protein
MWRNVVGSIDLFLYFISSNYTEGAIPIHGHYALANFSCMKGL